MDQRELFFVHVGKTGGTSVHKYLAQTNKASGSPYLVHRRRHSTAEQICYGIGRERWDNALTFSIVRNPFDRFVSACRQVRRNPNTPGVWKSISEYTAFEDKIAKHPRHIFVTQKDSTYIDGVLGVDALFKFEDGFDPVIAWLEEQGLSGAEFGHFNQKRLPPAKLCKEARQFVRDFYDEDFKAFGYDKR